MTGTTAAYHFVCGVWRSAAGIPDFREGHAFNSLKILFNAPESAGAEDYFVDRIHCVFPGLGYVS
jgi:hypothetical protein